jgi:hypothetical protein
MALDHVHVVDAGGSLGALAERYEIGANGDDVIKALGKRRADFPTVLSSKRASRLAALEVAESAAGREQALQELCGFLEEQMGLASGWLNSILTTSTPPCTELLTDCRLV